MRLLLGLLCSLLGCDGSSSGMGRVDSGGGSDTGPRALDTGPPPVDSGPPDVGPPDTGPACEYPTGAVEPMMRNMPLWPYRWPEAIDGMGRNFPIDLTEVACDADENIDWSPFDVLVFIAIPAW